MRSILSLGLLLLMAGTAVEMVRADDDLASGAKAAVSVSAKRLDADTKAGDTEPKVSLEQKSAAVMAFLKANHSELAALLGHLAASKPKDYEKAIHDLYRAQMRLEGIRQQDRSRYESALREWVIQSRIELLVAKLSMMDSEPLRAELKSLLNDQIEVRLTTLRAELQRAEDRTKKLNEQIAKLEQGRAASIERQFETLTRSAQNAKPAAAKPATGKRPKKADKPAAATSPRTAAP